MTVRTRNRLIALSIVAAPFIFLLCLLLFWDAEPLPPVPPLPSPNGYNDLVKAGQMITGDVWNYDEMGQSELRATAQSNSNAIQLARTGLQEKCRVTLDYSVTSTAHLDQLTALKRLAQAFAAQGRLAEMEKRPADAVQSDLDMIRLANDSASGGVIIDQLVGIAIEAIGVANLQKVIDQLDTKTCRDTAATLETLDSQRQTWPEVMQQERDWSRRTFPGIRNELGRLMSRNTLNKVYQNAEQRFEEQQSKTRQLIIEFAARAYELDKGHRPGNITDLVPDYLKAIPQDPLTGTNMVYLPK
ncbi:MAG TPA: hypothetical protein VN784_02810 [Candidatus Limnocylindrales bacterium]|nr:hypothetical protein [Candidatus Limnocylindrales bacterium]